MTIESSPAGTRTGADQAPALDVGYGRAGDRVTTALREMIANGQVLPGEHLRQDELATRLGSTRVPE